MADTNYKSIEAQYFLQNINAAREGAIIAQLARIKQEIDKIKKTMSEIDLESPKFKELESNLFDERVEFYKNLNLLVKIRSQIDKNLKNSASIGNPFKPQIRYVTDRDFYTPRFMDVSNIDHNYMKSKMSYSVSNSSSFEKGNLFDSSNI